MIPSLLPYFSLKEGMLSGFFCMTCETGGEKDGTW